MVTKAVLPVAGFGSRMLPASKAIPKEMLPVVDRPAIEYVVQEAVRAGIKEIILVSHSAKTAIEDYFDTQFELQHQLETKGKDKLLAEVRDILPDDVSVISVRQHRALGLGHAVACAAPVVGDSPFAVLLPDVLVDCDGQNEDLKSMVDRFDASGFPQIMVEEVPENRVDQYGIVALEGAAPARGESAVMRGVVEKPAIGEAPSCLSVVGRYVLPGEIMKILQNTPPGAGNEIQLTDAIATLMENQVVEAYTMRGQTFDCGNKAGYLQAIFHYAAKHPELGEVARSMMAETVG
ncbi:MAG: UTP--glucose-1-phosphate uridylyltransferase GalU [Pseudomonadales bacterium]|uniref:UTP--glucose-1-phosphate uridylyltransferase GalU n=1 Tax=Alcanivorax sp. MD8A TaxID=1177157 RepID=UPI000C9BA4EE|nr:UTP--glucose-1-phosphate uridylyltransferase GalU [Alcanivorax sp. MD8A]MCG8436472.1 UTP--glucose-1-phosphate uridylyltransferase GalU [Pseudomonadales bacterium]PNE02518.1 UTP-glucose-1-phosphate uridylyltransferase [Alcanivorax sp. MD8A]